MPPVARLRSFVLGDDAQRRGAGALADVHDAHGAAVVGVVVDLEEHDLLAVVAQALADALARAPRAATLSPFSVSASCASSSTTIGFSPGGCGTFSVCFCGTLATSSLSITGVITMKMMSSTSTMSMSGVTLISP